MSAVEKACSCSCCAERAARVAAGREPGDFCNCADYPEPEQCDCPSCLPPVAPRDVMTAVERAAEVLADGTVVSCEVTTGPWVEVPS